MISSSYSYRQLPSPDAPKVEELCPALAMLSTFLRAEIEAKPKAKPKPDADIIPFPAGKRV